MTKAEMLDQVETALVRASEAKKDIDLIVALRAVRQMLEDEVRKSLQKRAETNVL